MNVLVERTFEDERGKGRLPTWQEWGNLFRQMQAAEGRSVKVNVWVGAPSKTADAVCAPLDVDPRQGALL